MPKQDPSSHSPCAKPSSVWPLRGSGCQERGLARGRRNHGCFHVSDDGDDIQDDVVLMQVRLIKPRHCLLQGPVSDMASRQAQGQAPHSEASGLRYLLQRGRSGDGTGDSNTEHGVIVILMNYLPVSGLELVSKFAVLWSRLSAQCKGGAAMHSARPGTVCPMS